VLSLVQAMLGSITPNVRAVFLACTPDGVLLHFLLAQESADVREEIDEIVFEFSALQVSNVDSDMVVSVDTGRWTHLPLPRRMVYGRKEPV
jgi:hypothetical protein